VANDITARIGKLCSEPSYGMALALRPLGWRYTLSADLLLTKAEITIMGTISIPYSVWRLSPWTASGFWGISHG